MTPLAPSFPQFLQPPVGTKRDDSPGPFHFLPWKRKAGPEREVLHAVCPARLALSGHFAPIPGLLASHAGGQDKAVL